MSTELSPHGRCLACTRKDLKGIMHRVGTIEHPFSREARITDASPQSASEPRVPVEAARALIAALQLRRGAKEAAAVPEELVIVPDGLKPTWAEAKATTSPLRVQPRVVIFRLERIAALTARVTTLERTLKLFSEEEIQLRIDRYKLGSDFHKAALTEVGCL